MLAVALLMMLGALQIGLYGFGQTSADGAAFVASNAAANGVTAPTALAASVFPGIAAGDISIATPRPGVVIGQASVKMPGLAFVPGMPASLTIAGADIEPYTPTAQGNAPPQYAFGVNANLNNYCDPTTSCIYPAAHCAYLAQAINYSGNGKNGRFQEWYDHAGTYSSVSFPSSRPNGYAAIRGTDLDAYAAGTNENTIYSWDAGATC
jgi:hypothetical protein